jgi:hypothetical protein
MEVWIALLAGIIIGWLLEWIIDWLYWRRGIPAFYTTERELRHDLAMARQQVQELQNRLDAAGLDSTLETQNVAKQHVTQQEIHESDSKV